MEVAKAIHQQLTHKANLPKFWCWAAQAFKAFGPESFNKDYKHQGGLLFKVSARRHKGHIMVRLSGLDFYRVDFGYLRKGEFVPRKDMKPLEEVYCHNFVDLIDEEIEMVPEYTY